MRHTLWSLQIVGMNFQTRSSSVS
ncbi:DUF6783 domain-containing protein [Blautia producta]